MEITGYDSVVFSCVPVERFVLHIVAQIQRLWSGLRIDVELLDSDQVRGDMTCPEEIVDFIARPARRLARRFPGDQLAVAHDTAVNRGIIVSSP